MVSLLTEVSLSLLFETLCIPLKSPWLSAELVSSWLLLLFELASETADANCLELCSKVFAAFTFRLEMCFALSRACCSVDFHESRFEKMMLFVNLIADTALSAKLLTNLVYAFVTECGEAKLVTRPLKLSLYGLHADWSELITAF
jgi:hypothetical protein